MSYEAEYVAIADRFRTLWTGTVPERVQWGNARFSRPDPSPSAPEDTSWVRFNILTGGPVQTGYIGGKRRTQGIVSIQCFTPTGVSEVYARRLADKVMDIFDRKLFEAITCRTAYIDHVPPGDGWQQMNVMIPYWTDT